MSLENEFLRLAFRRNAFGFGPGEVSIKTPSGWATVAWMPRLSRVAFLDGKGVRRDYTVCVSEAPAIARGAGGARSPAVRLVVRRHYERSASR